MTGYIIGIIIAILFVGFVLWRLRARKQKSYETSQRGCPDSHVGTTAPDICLPRQWAEQIDRPDGGFVLTSRTVSQAERDIINQSVVSGIADMIRNTLRHNPTWTNYVNSGQYQVVLIDKMADTEAGMPALMTGGVKTAGTVVNVAYPGRVRRGTPIMVLPMPDDATMQGYAEWLYWSAFNEGEHYFEHENDLDQFWRFVGANDSHPHWPLAQAVGLAHTTRMSEAFRCRVETDADSYESVLLSGLRTEKMT